MAVGKMYAKQFSVPAGGGLLSDYGVALGFGTGFTDSVAMAAWVFADSAGSIGNIVGELSIDGTSAGEFLNGTAQQEIGFHASMWLDAGTYWIAVTNLRGTNPPEILFDSGGSDIVNTTTESGNTFVCNGLRTSGNTVTTNNFCIWISLLTTGGELPSGDANWTAATLAGGWGNAGGSHPSVGFRKDAGGFVHLRGWAVVTNGTLATGGVFTLPAGYRPDAATQSWFPALAGGTSMSPVVINAVSAGVVDINTALGFANSQHIAAGTLVGFDGITFFAAA